MTPGRTEKRILEVMGDSAITDDEIVARMSDALPATVKTARSRLTKAGLLVAVGVRDSARGRPMSVWKMARGVDA